MHERTIASAPPEVSVDHGVRIQRAAPVLMLTVLATCGGGDGIARSPAEVTPCAG